MKKEKYTVIIANGRFPQHKIPLSYINKASFIVCCDGAANNFIEQGGTPNAIVGDGDSISEINKQLFSSILHQVTNQDTNDLTKAVLFCIEKGIDNIIIVGGTGKREDHTLGNISLLTEYIDKVKVKMITNYGIFTPIYQTTVFKSFIGQQVSLFAFSDKSLSTEGLKYPLKDAKLTNWWQGTLNESTQKQFTIQTKGKLIVFQTFEAE